MTVSDLRILDADAGGGETGGEFGTFRLTAPRISSSSRISSSEESVSVVGYQLYPHRICS